MTKTNTRSIEILDGEYVITYDGRVDGSRYYIALLIRHVDAANADCLCFL